MSGSKAWLNLYPVLNSKSRLRETRYGQRCRIRAALRWGCRYRSISKKCTEQTFPPTSSSRLYWWIALHRAGDLFYMENSTCSSRFIRTSTNIPSLERCPLFIRLVNLLYCVILIVAVIRIPLWGIMSMILLIRVKSSLLVTRPLQDNLYVRIGYFISNRPNSSSVGWLHCLAV